MGEEFGTANTREIEQLIQNCPFYEFKVRFRRAELHKQGCRELGLGYEKQNELMYRLVTDDKLWVRMWKEDSRRAAVFFKLMVGQNLSSLMRRVFEK